jgi:hypothetical protein
MMCGSVSKGAVPSAFGVGRGVAVIVGDASGVPIGAVVELVVGADVGVVLWAGALDGLGFFDGGGVTRPG